MVSAARLQRSRAVTSNAVSGRSPLSVSGIGETRATGRRYQIDLDALDVQRLRELVRLIRDLDHEKQAAVNRARMVPWRR